MSEWSVWSPGGGSSDEVSGLAAVFNRYSLVFSRAASSVGSASAAARGMSSGAVSAWATRATRTQSELLSVSSGLTRLGAVFDTYANAVSSIRSRAYGLQGELPGSAQGAVEGMLGGHGGMSDSTASGVVASVQMLVDPPQPSQYDRSGHVTWSWSPSPVRGVIASAVFGLAGLSRERVQADQTFISEVQQTLGSVTGLFGVTPTDGEPAPPAGADVPPGSPGVDAAKAWLLGLKFGKSGFSWSSRSFLQTGSNQIREFGRYAPRGADGVFTPIDGRRDLDEFADRSKYRSLPGQQDMLRAGDEFETQGRKLGRVGAGLGVLAGGYGLYDDVRQAVSGNPDGGWGKLALSGVQNLAGTGAGVAEIVKLAGTKVGSRLVPGLGLAASAASLASDILDISHDTGATRIADGVAIAGDLLSTAGSVAELTGFAAPAGFVLNAVGTGLSLLAGAAKTFHWWGA